MYIFLDKENAKMFKKSEMAKKIGVHPDTIRKIINGKQRCTEIMAYCITKFLDKEAEITDYFYKKG